MLAVPLQCDRRSEEIEGGRKGAIAIGKKQRKFDMGSVSAGILLVG